MANLLIHPIDTFLQSVRYIGQMAILFGHTLYWTFSPPFKWDRFFIQAKRIGPESFLISSLVAFFIGMIIALQMAYKMVKLSVVVYILGIIAVSLTREMAPVLTALIVAGRIGASMTAELGTMAVTEQIDALKAFAVNPVKYLVVPRFLSLVLMLPVLTIFADLIGIMGGYLICVYKLFISPQMFFNMVLQTLNVKDVVSGLIKAVFFGIIIAMVGCHKGMTVKGGAEGVGKATTVSVVVSFIMIIISDCMFTIFFYYMFV